MKKLFPLCFILMSGCAHMITTHGDSLSQYAPLNEKEHRGGTIAIGANGIARENGYKKMHKFCDGPYKITDESIHPEGYGSGSTYTGIGLTGHLEQQYSQSSGTMNIVYLTFECK